MTINELKEHAEMQVARRIAIGEHLTILKLIKELERSIFHSTKEKPKPGSGVIIQYENGCYTHIDSIQYYVFERIFKGHKYTGPVVRWCYAEDLDGVK